MTHGWRGVTGDHNKKAHSDLNYAWTLNDTHQSPLCQIAKTERSERCENCGSRNRTRKFCTGRHQVSRSGILQLTDSVEDAYENAKALEKE